MHALEAVVDIIVEIVSSNRVADPRSDRLHNITVALCLARIFKGCQHHLNMLCCTDSATAQQCSTQELMDAAPWSDRSINTCSAHGLIWLWMTTMAAGTYSSVRCTVICVKQPSHRAVHYRVSDLHLGIRAVTQCGVCLLQVDLVAMPEGPDNPHGNGFWAKETPLLTESKAMRMADPAAARAWKISNPASTHPVTGMKAGGALHRQVKGSRSGWQTIVPQVQ